MITEPVTGRQRREAVFHDRWAAELDPDDLAVEECFEACTALENRYALDAMGPLHRRRLLDLGCGAGETSVYLALRGSQVTAVDISLEMLRVTGRLARSRDMPLHKVQAGAERLIIFGNGVLHHVDLESSLLEIRRVLRPGGKAIFVEPLAYNPVIGVYRRLARTVRTEDERPFRFSHLRLMRRYFSSVDHREFWLLSLAIFLYMFFVERIHPAQERYWKRIIREAARYEGMLRILKSWDDRLLSAFPLLGRLCWNTVLIMVR